jgi:hypothetical protein
VKTRRPTFDLSTCLRQIIPEGPPASSRACSQRLLLLPLGFIAAVAIAVLPFATMSPDADSRRV